MHKTTSLALTDRSSPSGTSIFWCFFFISHVKWWNRNFYLHSQKRDLKCFVNQVRIFSSYTAKARTQFWKQGKSCGEDKAKETPKTKKGFNWSITRLPDFQVTIYQNKMRFKSLTIGIFTPSVLVSTPTENKPRGSLSCLFPFLPRFPSKCPFPTLLLISLLTCLPFDAFRNHLQWSLPVYRIFLFKTMTLVETVDRRVLLTNIFYIHFAFNFCIKTWVSSLYQRSKESRDEEIRKKEERRRKIDNDGDEWKRKKRTSKGEDRRIDLLVSITGSVSSF